MLTPVSYKWIKDRYGGQTHQGLIAQEVEETMNSFDMFEEDNFLVNYDENEDKYRMNYNKLIAPLIKSIQELNIKNDNYNDKMLISLLKESEKLEKDNTNVNLKLDNNNTVIETLNSKIIKLEDTNENKINILNCNVKELFNKNKR